MTRRTMAASSFRGELIDELIERFGAGAVVTADPVMLGSGDTYRWELQIDGTPIEGVYPRERRLQDHPDGRVLLMVSGDEEVELVRWSTKVHPRGPARVIETLGGLRRRV